MAQVTTLLTRAVIRIICTTFIILASPCLGSDSKFQLSSEEQTWLNKNHTVRVRIGNSPPFMFTDGEIRGIAIDYLTNIFNRNGLKIHYIKQSEVTWPQALKYIEQHDVVDMVPTAKITNERKKHMLFTNEYIFAPWVIFTKSNADFVSSIEDLNGKTVAVEEGYVIHEKLKQEYPGINLKVVSSKLQNYAGIPLRDLSTGLVDAYIGNLLSTTYLIQLNGYANVKVAAPTPFDNHNQAMAIRNDWPELISIINKTLYSMTIEEHAAIRNRWLSVRYEYGTSNADILKWILSILVAASFIIGFVLIWNRRLKTEMAHRKKIEENLKKSEAHYAEAQMVAHIGHWELYPEIGTPVWSDEIFRIFGLNPQEVEPSFTDHETHLHFDDWPILNKAVTLASAEGTPFDITFRIVQPDDEIRWMHALGTTTKDEKGKVTKLFGTAQDITERKQAEESLKKSNLLLSSVIESPDNIIIFVLDTDYNYLNFNMAHVREMKRVYDADIEIGQHMLTYIPREDDRLKVEGSYKRVLQGKRFVKIEEYGQSNNRFWYELIFNPIHDTAHHVTGFTVFVTDVTKRRQLEEQLRQSQKMESIGTLTGGIAHDFNNILGIIVGNTELALIDVPEWNPVHSNLEEIKTASLRATKIVKQLLAFSRKTDQKMQPIEIVLVIKDALKFLRSTIPTTVDIQQDIQATDETILADPTQINQIMMNLCINASQAMEQTGGNITVNVEKVILDDNSAKSYPDLRSGKHVKVTVSDTGPGIDPEIIDRIFDPYFTTKEVGKGSGMGLSVVLGIVKNHHGAIAVDSKPGKGTTFSILFPMTTEKPEIEKDTTEELLLGNEKVLFVDDENLIVKMVRKLLELLGYQVETQMNPVEALEQFQSKPDQFDLVITDMTMPQMTGVMLSEKIMEIRPDIPIIICTGHSALIDEERAKQLGIAAYVMKPIIMTEISKTIRKVLDEAKASTQQ